MTDRVKDMVLSVLEGIFLGKQTRMDIFNELSEDIERELDAVGYPYISDVQSAVVKVMKRRIYKS